MSEDGSYAILLTVSIKGGLIQEPVLLRASGYTSESDEHREWINLELKNSFSLSINVMEGAENDAPYSVFDPNRVEKQ